MKPWSWDLGAYQGNPPVEEAGGCAEPRRPSDSSQWHLRTDLVLETPENSAEN